MLLQVPIGSRTPDEEVLFLRAHTTRPDPPYIPTGGVKVLVKHRHSDLCLFMRTPGTSKAEPYVERCPGKNQDIAIHLRWVWHEGTGTLRVMSRCLASTKDKLLGVPRCLPEQSHSWSYQGTSGVIQSLSTGQCLAVNKSSARAVPTVMECELASAVQSWSFIVLSVISS